MSNFSQCVLNVLSPPVSPQAPAFSCPVQSRWMSFDHGSLTFGTTLLFLTCKKGRRTASRWETTANKSRKLSPASNTFFPMSCWWLLFHKKCWALILLVCCDASGPRPEGGMGGPSGVGEGHPALAVCPAGPGKAVPLAAPQHQLQQPWSALRGEASQGNSTQLHGIRSTGKTAHVIVNFI